MFAKILNLLTFGWLNKFANSLLKEGIVEGKIEKEKEILRNKRECKYHELSEFMGKYIIVVGNNWGPPHVGKVTEVVFLGEQDSSPFLQTVCVFTGETLIHFGKHVVFTYPILKALMSINPYERWTMLTNQETRGWTGPDILPNLIAYEVMEKSLLKIIPKD